MDEDPKLSDQPEPPPATQPVDISEVIEAAVDHDLDAKEDAEDAEDEAITERNPAQRPPTEDQPQP